MFARDYALNQIYIKGEVSNCKYHTSGHIYFTLKDHGGQIACVMFASQRQGLRFKMTEGQSVVVLGSVSVYERDGKYQLYAREILLDGAGELYEKFEQLKQKLSDEGLFSQSHKQPIPQFVKRLGVVTAKTGAAIQDIINITKRRNPYVQIILYPAIVQGEKAAASIVKGIQKLDALGVDVIIVGRGGGSIEDLWAFNEESVARSIYEAKTPIISSVGHETDVTIADYVADLRAPTPSAGAELAIADVNGIYETLYQAQIRMVQLLKLQIMNVRKELTSCQTKLKYLSPEYKLKENRQIVSDYYDRMQDAMERMLTKKRYELKIYMEKLEGLSPLTQLSRGYALVLQDDQVVSSVTAVSEGKEITVEVSDGQIQALVTSKKQIKRL